MAVKFCEAYLLLNRLSFPPGSLIHDSAVLSTLRQNRSPMGTNTPLRLRLFAKYRGICLGVSPQAARKSVSEHLTWITRLLLSLIKLRKAFARRLSLHGIL